MKKKRLEYPPGTNMQPIIKKWEEDDLAFWASLDKEDWIAAARARSSHGESEWCEVCKKHTSITQAHHIVPLGEQYDRKFRRPNQRIAWLCPNHHTMIHHFRKQRDFRVAGIWWLKTGHDLTEEQIEIIADLIKRSREGFP